MSLKLQLSARPGMAIAQRVAGAGDLDIYRKDYIIVGKWKVKTPDGLGIFDVTPERIQRWEKTHLLLLSRGVTVPLTVDHMEIHDPVTGKLLLKKLTPAMAEAKRGTVLSLDSADGRGFCNVKPADAETITLLGRCPEVSLELTQDLVDGLGNYYDEAITAITLTPKPVVQGQQQEWIPLRLNDSVVQASWGLRGTVMYLSAEPLVEDPGINPPIESDLETPMPMTAAQIVKARKILKMGAEVTDAQVEGAVTDGLLGHCDELQTKLDTLTATQRSDADRILQLSREIETKTTELKASGAKVTRLSIIDIAKEIDVDGMDMMATAIQSRINALGTHATPAQRTMLMSWLVGTTAQRNVIALSRKAAEQVGLPETLANTVLSIFEAGNPADMLKMLNENSGVQKAGVRLSHTLPDPSGAPQEDPKLQQNMIDNINGSMSGAKAKDMVL